METEEQRLEREQNERDVLEELHGRVTTRVVPEQVLYWVGGAGGEECGKEKSCWPFAVKYSIWVGGAGGEECGKEEESCWPFAVSDYLNDNTLS